MEDRKYIIDGEYPPATEALTENAQTANGQYPGHPPPSYGYGQTVFEVHPTSQTMVRQHPAIDESSIKTKSIVSIVLSALTMFCVCSMFCAIPALVFGGLALAHVRSDPDKARSYSTTAAGLTFVATIIAAIGIGLTIWAVTTDDGYYTTTNSHYG